MKKITLLFAIVLFFLSANAQTVFTDFSKTFKGHRTTVNEIEFSNDGSLLYSCGGNNQILVFDTKTAEIVKRTEPNGFEKPINQISLNYESSLLAWATFNGDKVSIVNTDDFSVFTEIDGLTGIDDIKFSPIYNNITVVGYNDQKKQIVSSFDAETGLLYVNYFTQTDETLPICVDFSSDSELLACGICNYNQGVRIYDFNNGDLKLTISAPDDINMIKFSPDDKYIAGACGDGNVYVWNVSDGQLVHKLTGLNDIVMTLDFHPDGKSIVAAGFDNTCTFKSWNIETGELIQSMGDKGPQIMCVTHNPVGDAIAVAYRTYGDLFEVPSINVFYTEKASSEVEWVKINSNENGLIIELPEEPEVSVKSDQYYKYYDYLLQVPGKSYQVRATEYLYDINDSKRKQTIDKKAQSFESSKSNVSSIDYSLGNYPVFEKIGYKGDLRYHQRVIFVDNVMYSIVYIDYEKETNAEEERFFNSFSVK